MAYHLELLVNGENMLNKVTHEKLSSALAQAQCIIGMTTLEHVTYLGSGDVDNWMAYLRAQPDNHPIAYLGLAADYHTNQHVVLYIVGDDDSEPDETYNGWVNYNTWAAYSHITSYEFEYAYARSISNANALRLVYTTNYVLSFIPGLAQDLVQDRLNWVVGDKITPELSMVLKYELNQIEWADVYEALNNED